MYRSVMDEENVMTTTVDENEKQNQTLIELEVEWMRSEVQEHNQMPN